MGCLMADQRLHIILKFLVWILEDYEIDVYFLALSVIELGIKEKIISLVSSAEKVNCWLRSYKQREFERTEVSFRKLDSAHKNEC